MKKIFLLSVCMFAVFTASAQGFANETVNSGRRTRSYSSSPVEFQAYANVGTVFTGQQFRYGGYDYDGEYSLYSQVAGPTVDVSAGIMIHDRFYIGAELGAQLLFESYEAEYISDYYGSAKAESEESAMGVYIPVGLNMKGYILKDRTINPFVNASFGGGFVAGNTSYDHGLYCQVGGGIEWKRYSFGVGYNLLFDVGDAMHAGYIKLGVRIGK